MMNSINKEKTPAHYEVPNLASMLYDYTNKEHDIVKQAFRPTNFHSLRDLPNDLAPFSVS